MEEMDPPGSSPDRCTYWRNGRVRSNQGFTVQQIPNAGSGKTINPCSDCNGQGNTQTSKNIRHNTKGVDDGTS